MVEYNISDNMVTIGSIKKPGTFERVKVRSGVVGRGGGIFASSGQLLSRISPSVRRELEEEGKEAITQITQIAPSVIESATDKAIITGLKPEARTTVEQVSEITPGTTGGPGGGLIFITPAEARSIRQAGGTRQPVFEVESPPTPRGSIEAIEIESKFAAQVQPSTDALGIGVSKGQFESNILQIQLAKEGFRAERIFRRDVISQQKLFQQDPTQFRGRAGFEELVTDKGTEFSLGEEFFETLPSAKAREQFFSQFEEGTLTPEALRTRTAIARTEFEGLGLGERLKGTTLEFGVGAAQLGIGVTEGIIGFSTKLGVQTFQPGEKELGITGFKTPSFEFGGAAGRITDIPTARATKKFTQQPFSFLGEVLLERPALGFKIGAGAAVITSLGLRGISDIRTLGFKGAAVETARLFSPIRIPSGVVFAPDVSKSIFEGQAVEFKQGDISRTFFRGADIRDPSIRLGSFQIAGKTGGVSVGVIETPQFIIPRGGVVPIQGTGTTTFATAFGGRPSGQFGFIGKAATVPLFTTSVFPGQVPAANIFTTQIPTIKDIGGVRIGDKGFFAFTGGEIKQGFITSRPFVSPTGQRSFDFFKGTKVNIRGLGLKFEIPSPQIGDRGFTTFGGGGTKTPFSQTFGATINQVISKPIIIQPPPPTPTGLDLSAITKSIIPGAVPGVTTPSRFTGLGLDFRRGTDLFFPTQKVFRPTPGGAVLDPSGGLIFRGRDIQRFFTGADVRGGLADLTRQRGIAKQLGRSISSQLIDTSQLQLQTQAQQQRQGLKQLQASAFATAFISPPTITGFGGGFGAVGGGFIFPPLRFPFGERPGRKERIGATFPKIKIAPSLTGISRFQFGGITGPLPKELLKGIGILPGQIRFVPEGLKPRRKKRKVLKRKKKN